MSKITFYNFDPISWYEAKLNTFNISSLYYIFLLDFPPQKQTP
jgi:hypothetical protein